MKIWDRLSKNQYLSLAPWAWVQLESAEPPGPFPFVAGVAPEVVASLHEAHSLFSSAIDTAISDVFSKRAPLDDPDRQRRLEDAMAGLYRGFCCSAAAFHTLRRSLAMLTHTPAKISAAPKNTMGSRGSA